MTSTPVLLVDDRQDASYEWSPGGRTRVPSGTLDALREHFDVRVKHLTTGDMVWTSSRLGTVGIEDKCMTDLMDSRRNGRLDDELRRLVDSFAVPVLFVRGTLADSRDKWHDDWTPVGVENLLLGRQLHGVYVYRCLENTPGATAAGIRGLHEYFEKAGPLEGVRRDRQFAYIGPMSARAEAIYGLLGMVRGIRDRRGVSERLAAVASVGQLLRWSVADFEHNGFTHSMSRKLAETLHEMEEGE